MSPETLRKAGVGVKLVADADMLHDGVALREHYDDHFAERQKLRDLSYQVNNVYRKEARDELLRETVIDAVDRLDPISPIVYARQYGYSEQELVLCIGDIHYGADIKVEGLDGEIINRYNKDVFESRMEKLFDETVDIIDAHRIGKVHLFMVGDLIDGMFRQSQLMRLEFGMVDSTMGFAEYMANWINSLSAYVDIDVAACSGNHSEIRPIGSKKRDFPNENMERLILWYMHARLADNVRVDVDETCRIYNKKEVLGYTFLLVHGDAEKSIPDLAAETIRLYAKPIDFFICGHKHRENEFPTGSTPEGTSVVMRVPSVCGTDMYANSKGFGGKAGATAVVMERGYGRRCIYPINL